MDFWVPWIAGKVSNYALIILRKGLAGPNNSLYKTGASCKQKPQGGVCSLQGADILEGCTGWCEALETLCETRSLSRIRDNESRRSVKTIVKISLLPASFVPPRAVHASSASSGSKEDIHIPHDRHVNLNESWSLCCGDKAIIDSDILCLTRIHRNTTVWHVWSIQFWAHRSCRIHEDVQRISPLSNEQNSMGAHIYENSTYFDLLLSVVRIYFGLPQSDVIWTECDLDTILVAGGIPFVLLSQIWARDTHDTFCLSSGKGEIQKEDPWNPVYPV